MHRPPPNEPGGKGVARQKQEFTDEGAPPPASPADTAAAVDGSVPSQARPSSSKAPGEWRPLR